MKNIYLLSLLFVFTLTSSFGQERSTDIQADLADVSLNVSSGNETYNLEDLQFHASRASEAIRRVIISLEASNCSKALSLANEIAGLMDACMVADNHGDGRINISSAKDLITQTFYEFDVCSVKGDGAEALSELEQQQSNLRLQQIELELKAKQIERQLAEQKEKESYLKKQKFIDSNKKVLISSLRTYNEQLKACQCGATVSDNETTSLTKLTSESLAQIKSHYLNRSISLTKRFLEKLKNCKD